MPRAPKGHHHHHHDVGSSIDLSVHDPALLEAGTDHDSLDPTAGAIDSAILAVDAAAAEQYGHVGSSDDAEAAAAAAAAVANATAANAAAVAAVARAAAGMDDSQRMRHGAGTEAKVDLNSNGKPRLKRTAITHEQRKALREWFFSQDPRPSQAKSIVWFHERYDRVISQAAISHSLHDRYKHLDFVAGAPSSSYRQRNAQWPELEAILFDYLQAIERKNNGRSAFPNAVSGEALTKAAKQIWENMPMYANQPEPTFSNGWVSRFKGRYKTYKQFGDATAVDIKSLQTLTSGYSEENIYTMDETGLYWKRGPSITSATRDKAKITIIMGCNASGSDKLPLWVIGRSREARSLTDINLESLFAQWRSNENAWLTGPIMEDWLRSFYDHVGNRSVLLILDNFSAHIQGLAEAPPPSNVRIQFLPANSSAVFQPLEKGIVDQFKIGYRLHWLEYIANAFNKGQDPHDMVTIRDAIRFATRSWDHDLPAESIRYCFYEAAILAAPSKQIKNRAVSTIAGQTTQPVSMFVPPVAPHLPAMDLVSPLYNQIWQSHRLPDMITLGEFLSFSAEESIDLEEVNDADVLQSVINYHLGLSDDGDSKGDGLTGDMVTEQIMPSTAEVMGYLEMLMLYLERRGDTKRSQMRSLEEIEMELEKDYANQLR